MITFPFLHTLLFALFSRGLSPNSHPNSLLNMLTNEVFNLALNESILKLSELLLSVLVDRSSHVFIRLLMHISYTHSFCKGIQILSGS